MHHDNYEALEPPAKKNKKIIDLESQLIIMNFKYYIYIVPFTCGCSHVN